MGISGLLQALKSTATRKGNIREFAQQSVAVDASSWLHKSVYSIADHYVECMENNHNKPDERCIRTSSNYIIKRCHELLRYAQLQRIYLVMDGARCPLKAVTNDDRERQRQQNLQQARAALGNKDKMYEKYKACIKVHNALTKAVMARVQQHFAQHQVLLVWAPYEADAQLIQLCVQHKTQAVITEDSDVLVYAATCRTPVPILFKLNRDTGTCDVTSMQWLLQPSDLTTTTNATNKKQSGLQAFLQAFAIREQRTRGLGVRLFVQSCVLAGCDYAPNDLAGVGTVTAFKHVRSALHRISNERFGYILNTVLSTPQRESLTSVTQHEVLLSQSEAVFYYHPVINTQTNQIAYLNDPITTTTTDMPCLDRFGDDWTAFLGLLQPSPLAAAPTAAPAAAKQSMFRQKQAYAAQAKKRAAAITNNPYVSRKRPALQPKSPNQTAAAPPAKAQQQQHENPFHKFGRKEQPKTKTSLLDFYQDKQDVRFVKRSFPKDGSRTALPPKPIIVPTKSSQPMVRPDKKHPTKDTTLPKTDVIDLALDDSSDDEEQPPAQTFQIEQVSESPYFKPSISRRVTLEPEPAEGDEVEHGTRSDDDDSSLSQQSPEQSEPECSNSPTATKLEWNKNTVSAASKFDLYDDFLSPKKQEPYSEEIIDSSPDLEDLDVPKGRPLASIGPASTLTFRFQPPPSTARRMQTQSSQLPSLFHPVASRSQTSRRKPITMLRMSQPPRKKQTTLHSLFARK